MRGAGLDSASRHYALLMVPNRFCGLIAERADCHEDKTLKAIKSNAGGLARISGERIWSELRRILEGKFAGDIMKVMLSIGIGPHIGKLDFLKSCLIPYLFKFCTPLIKQEPHFFFK
jgi:tRNA nucleotidyltransferase (CCA-adding enzyme)